MSPIAGSEDDLICDECGKALFKEVLPGYVGPQDRSDTGCNPFAKFEILCIFCEQKRAQKEVVKH